VSENLIHIKASHPCGSEQCIQGGNELGEATASNVLGRNESECIEPRNACRHGGQCSHYNRRQHSYLRNWQADKNSIGVLGNGMVQDGCYLNLGDPFISFETISFKSTCKQVLKHEDAWMNKWKSELLILLGAWESQVHGEAAAEMKLEKIRLALS
jgi:hypothetical protein